MTKFSTSNLPFTIPIFPYPMGQPAHLEEYFWKKSVPRIISVRGRGRLYRECLSVAFFDFSSPLESDDELSDQSATPPGLHPAIVLTAAPLVSNYTEKDLQ